MSSAHTKALGAGHCIPFPRALSKVRGKPTRAQVAASNRQTVPVGNVRDSFASERTWSKVMADTHALPSVAEMGIRVLKRHLLESARAMRRTFDERIETWPRNASKFSLKRERRPEVRW
jgi:hypothetical protein